MEEATNKAALLWMLLVLVFEIVLSVFKAINYKKTTMTLQSGLRPMANRLAARQVGRALSSKAETNVAG